jgi:DNA-binding transcriptional LysR family regulator
MDINSLKAFIKVAEEGSFSLAGESLHLTQPAISKRIAVLESELGTRLFDRIGRQVSLTEGGRALLPRALHMLDEVADIRRSLASLKGEVAGTLSMGTSHHIGLRRLPPILRQYSTQYPEVQLDIHFMDSESACSAVEQGRLELGIVTLPTRPAPNLELIPLWQDPLYFVVSPDHPLSNLPQPSLEALAQHQAVLPGMGTYTREILEQALAPKGGRGVVRAGDWRIEPESHPGRGAAPPTDSVQCGQGHAGKLPGKHPTKLSRVLCGTFQLRKTSL